MQRLNQIDQSFIRRIKENILYYFVNAYLLYALILTLIYSTENNFIRLQTNQNYLYGLLLTPLFIGIQFFIQHLFPKLTSLTIFSVLASSWLFVISWLAPSPLIPIGLLLFAFILFYRLYRQDHPLKLLLLLNISFIIVRAYQLFCLPQTYQLEPFIIDVPSHTANLYFALFFAIILSLLVTLGQRLIKINWRSHQGHHSGLKWFIRVCLGFIIITSLAYMLIVMYGKSMTMDFSTFDKGIFSQMFANMNKGLGPITTLERDRLLSHFKVHVSPIYYLMLPFYHLHPYPETVELLQVLIVFSGILPFYLISRQLELPKHIRGLLLVLYAVTPTLSTGHGYGIHENCFLAPLLLWLIFANLRHQQWQQFFFAFLVMMVKEDAVIYLVSLGIFFLMQKVFPMTKKEKLLICISQIIIPIIYFGACIFWLKQYGDGAMTTRFVNFMLPGQDSLKHVIENILMNPTFTITSLFAQRKLTYFVTIFACQAFLPLMQVRWENYILLLPMLVINLLSNYLYQVDFGFQYHYGSTALTLFMSLLALKSMTQDQAFNLNLLAQDHKMSQYTLFATTCSLFLFIHFVKPMSYSIDLYLKNPQTYLERQETLTRVPRQGKVLVFGYYTNHLADISDLYDIFYHNKQQFDPTIDTVVVPRTMLHEKKVQSDLLKDYLEHGFKESSLSSDQVLILTK